MEFDDSSGLLVDLGGTFFSILSRRQLGFYQYLQNRCDRSLLIYLTKHPFDFAGEPCKDPNSPNSNYSDEALGTVVGEGDNVSSLRDLQI